MTKATLIGMVGGYIDSDGSVTCVEGHYNIKLTQQNPQSLAVLNLQYLNRIIIKDGSKTVKN